MYSIHVPGNTTFAEAASASLYPQAVILPILAFPSWILCIPPLLWHFRQGNIAAGSLILWCIMVNFFNAINPLIWPRDNLSHWWHGSVWCDINVRIQVGAVVGTTASAAMIVRKLAKVMDTSNITVSTSRNHKRKEHALEMFWCWGYPLIMMVLYYIVQPARYMIFGIVGCISPFDRSWPSIVVSYMWVVITTCVAGGYALILTYRLYRYRREFIRLVAARNTTKSRFIRLFTICIIIILVYMPYATYLVVALCRSLRVSNTPYSWNRVHDPVAFNTIIRVASLGAVTIDKWGQVITGYVIFFVFGTGSDAENMYKSALTGLGLGKWFPGLYTRRQSGAGTPRSFVAVRSWSESVSSRAKSLWSSTRTDSVDGTVREGSVAGMESVRRLRTGEMDDENTTSMTTRRSVFTRFFAKRTTRDSILPRFAQRSVTEMTDTNTHTSTTTRDRSPGVEARVWATDKAGSPCVSEADGVHVCRENECTTHSHTRLTHADIHGSIAICANEQFLLGRDPGCCRYCWSDDLTISRRHLRIHCILYDQDPISEVAPFVYATNVSVNGTFLKKSNPECTGSQGRGILMGQNNTFLLDEGDELHLSETVWLEFSSVKDIYEAKFTAIQEREKAIFARDYLITGRLLGEGGYGKVLVGIEQATQRQLACKMIRLDHLYENTPLPSLRQPTGPRARKGVRAVKRWPTRVVASFREFDILKELRHPNVISIEKVFWSNSSIYIFLELVTGGDLFSYLEYKGGRLDNAQATVVIRQVLVGLEYLHEHEIVHRDLKPDNILMTSLDDGARVVITDFGNARYLPDAGGRSQPTANKYRRMFSYVGTLEFAAPEIHRVNPTVGDDEGYSKSVDMWSIGAITATVLSGECLFTNRTHPLYDENPRMVIMGLAARCDLSVLDDEYHPSWSEVEPLAKDFIKRLLVLKEHARMTSTQALAHRWFSNECYAEDLEDVYRRSIEGWKPRHVSSQLVERISKSLPDLTAVGLPGEAISQDNVSRFVHPSEQKLTQNIIQTLSASQYWRANTPLPSITEDYENANFHYASQVRPPSNDGNQAGYVDHLSRNVHDRDSSLPQSLGVSQASNQLGEHYDEYGCTQHGPSDSQHQDSINTLKATGRYRNEPGDGTNAKDEDLDNVIDLTNSQYEQGSGVQHPRRPPQEVILV
ncbi:pheromone A receptor-domain-containing protein [Paraphoma chrysanthemicola]|uniref:Pheromone A receptor-domain-containing protein n=1 Tax=Paraphoma chrysanthemicola TaxID=798071 RepID=A0A8K0R9G3_9PLEO|nr:pheromone A receptor-domain-containing protein [Paraphoma chrysanthemicola]